MSENENMNQSFSDFIMNIKKINAIVIVDDVRTITDEDMKEIHKGLELKDKISEGNNIIDVFKGKNHFLSNFYQCDFVYEGLTYHTAEAAFQAQKCSSEEDKIKYTEVKNPVAAKRMGRREPNLPENWNEISYDIMKNILKAKFAVPEMKEKLLATGNATLVEGNKHHDNIWGRCVCEKCLAKNVLGLNRLGNILMEVRDSYDK